MKISMSCPECNGHNFDPFDDCSGMMCQDCGHFIPDKEIELFAQLHPEYKDVQRLGKPMSKLVDYTQLICPSCHVTEPFNYFPSKNFILVTLPTATPYQGNLYLKICIKCGYVSTRFPVSDEDKNERFIG